MSKSWETADGMAYSSLSMKVASILSGVLSGQHKAPVEPARGPDLEHAIHIAAVTHLRNDTNGRIYYDKKIAAGKTPKEAIRALKRRISNAAYRALVVDAPRPAAN